MKRLLPLSLILLSLNAISATDPVLKCREELSANQEAAAQSLCLGKAHLAAGKPADAVAAFKVAEERSTDPFQKIVAILFLARATLATDQPEEAIAHYQRALKQAVEVRNKQAQMMSLNEIGQILLAKGEAKQALERFQAAYLLAANDNERSECHQNIASAYHALKEVDHAIEYQLKSVLMEERSGEGGGYLNARLVLSTYLAEARDFSRSQKELDEVLVIARNASSPYWEARTLLYAGKMEKLRGNAEKAMAFLRDAAAIAEKIGVQELRAAINAETQLSQ